MLSFRKLSITVCFFFVFNSLNAQDTLPDKNWLRFNVQGAFIANNSFSNLSFPFLYSEKAGKTSNYTKNSSKPVCYGFNGGLELILGKDPVLKYVIYNSKQQCKNSPSRTQQFNGKSYKCFIQCNYRFGTNS